MFGNIGKRLGKLLGVGSPEQMKAKYPMPRFPNKKRVVTRGMRKAHSRFMNRVPVLRKVAGAPLNAEVDERNRLIRGMTNWQNSQWMRAGCPQGLELVETFATLKKPKSLNAYQEVAIEHFQRVLQGAVGGSRDV